MIQAIGVTSVPREELPPTAADVSFEAPTGRITALLGGEGSGRSTVLRLMLGLQPGRGTAHFRGRPLHRVPDPAREVGAVLGEVPGHPARTVRGHLRMLGAAVGATGRRVDEVLTTVGLEGLEGERLGDLSHGTDRRLALGCALLAAPHALVLDAPADALAARERAWLHGLLRTHASLGGTVLFGTDDAKEAARHADRVVTLVDGRVVADQEAADFARTRLRPRVAVRSPHAVRLGQLVVSEARAARRPVEVVTEGGNHLAVYGGSCAAVGEVAYRHGILVHRLADETGDDGPGTHPHPAPLPVPTTSAASTALTARRAPAAPTASDLPTATGGRRRDDPPATRSGATGAERTGPPATGPSPATAHRPEGEKKVAAAARDTGAAAVTETAGVTAPTPSPTAVAGASSPVITVRPPRSPLHPVRYELLRATGVATGYRTGAAVLVVSALLAVVLARTGHVPQARCLAAWPGQLPLPPAALGAGLLGALASGDEFRYPALAPARGAVPRRLGLLGAKLVVAAVTALLLALLVAAGNLALLRLVYGGEVGALPERWPALVASWCALVTGCAWAGVLAAGLFKSTAAGLAAVLAVPLLVVPGVQRFLTGASVRTAAGFPARLHAYTMWPFGTERYLAAALRAVAQPVGGALALSLAVLLSAYLLTMGRGRAR
ncbi:ATP-binding cassette domain-containing protein [Streptomyces sp. JNUCC 64]